jgi:hypothetical protein
MDLREIAGFLGVPGFLPFCPLPLALPFLKAFFKSAIVAVF